MYQNMPLLAGRQLQDSLAEIGCRDMEVRILHESTVEPCPIVEHETTGFALGSGQPCLNEKLRDGHPRVEFGPRQINVWEPGGMLP
jgi:hypothetical protein